MLWTYQSPVSHHFCITNPALCRSSRNDRMANSAMAAIVENIAADTFVGL